MRDILWGDAGRDFFQMDRYWTGVRWANRDFPMDYHQGPEWIYN